MLVIDQLKKDEIPYITATHDINNPRSGEVMKKLGMKYQYSYKEQWQPKDILVTFRMYQLNLIFEYPAPNPMIRPNIKTTIPII